MSFYSVLTPYIIPRGISNKKVNLGDGFILSAVKRMLPFSSLKYAFSTKQELTDAEILKINQGKALIIAGANQLKDTYSLWPNFSFRIYNKISVPIIPLGVGYKGGIGNADIKEMSKLTKKIIIEIHKNIAYSSWRCYRTTKYLKKFAPELSEKILMTGCPVIYGHNLLKGGKFSTAHKNIVYTPTERGEWKKREYATLNFILKNFKNSNITMVLHQDFSKISLRDSFYCLKGNMTLPKIFHSYARKRGVKIVIPKTIKEGEGIYNECDLHIGSRLHAHLYSLSLCKRSFLTYVDERAESFAEYLNFPIVDYKKIGDCLDYDFEIYRESAIKHYKVMEKFINYLREIL